MIQQCRSNCGIVEPHKWQSHSDSNCQELRVTWRAALLRKVQTTMTLLDSKFGRSHQQELFDPNSCALERARGKWLVIRLTRNELAVAYSGK